VKVTIDPTSIASDNPPAGFMDQLRSAQWLDAAKFPQLTFTSTKVTRTGPKALRIDGELNLHGIKRPLTLDATYNGGYAGHPMDPNARIGFSAHGTLKRSQFGIAFGVPAPGTTMGVSDDVEVIVETEFTGPHWAGAKAAH
jgi:polyisoprenoid-binding protein YceI